MSDTPLDSRSLPDPAKNAFRRQKRTIARTSAGFAAIKAASPGRRAREKYVARSRSFPGAAAAACAASSVLRQLTRPAWSRALFASVWMIAASGTAADAAPASVAANGQATTVKERSAGANNLKSYAIQNDAAMTKMMRDMDTQSSGDVDHDFVAMMVPHHQGGIDMAMAVLRYGKNEQLRRLAQEIIVTQQQEISAMRLALGQPLPPSHAAPTSPAKDTGARSATGSIHHQDTPR